MAVGTVTPMGDCESFHEGLLAEPVNALSSLAYVAAGAWVWRHDRPRGTALMAVGAGSVAYHARGGTAAHWLHDGTIAIVAAVVAASVPSIVRGARVSPRAAAFAVGAFALAVPLQLFGRTGGPLCRPDSVWQAHAGWHVLTAVALGGAFALSRRVATPGANRGAQVARAS
jgi:hypothetical protein